MILLTGSTGFVGRHLLAKLAKRGERMRCLVHRSRPPSRALADNVEFARGSVADLLSLRAAIRDVDTVIHLVAVIRETRTATFSDINHVGTRNVLVAAKGEGVQRIIHVSALGASPNAQYPYTHSKWLAEEEVRQSGIAYTILQPSIIFGEGDEFINRLAQIVRLAPVVPIIGTGTTPFQPIWVEDLVRCILTALDEGQGVGQTIPIGGPEHLSYEQIVDAIASALGKRRMKVHLPVSIMRPMVRLMETMLPKPPVTTAQLAMLELENVTDLNSVYKHFGFAPAALSKKIDYIR